MSIPPNLYSPADTNSAVLTSLTPVVMGVGSTAPLTLSGSGLGLVTQVGFFKSNDLSPAPIVMSLASFTVNGSGTLISISAITTLVTSTETTWWVRVFLGGRWSRVGDVKNPSAGAALPLWVGNAIGAASMT